MLAMLVTAFDAKLTRDEAAKKFAEVRDETLTICAEIEHELTVAAFNAECAERAPSTPAEWVTAARDVRHRYACLCDELRGVTDAQLDAEDRAIEWWAENGAEEMALRGAYSASF